MDISKLNLTEAKAIAYDCIGDIEASREKLRLANARIIELKKAENETLPKTASKPTSRRRAKRTAN